MNIDVEKDILIVLFRDRSLLAWASSRLVPEDFQNEIYGDIWFIIRKLWNKYREPITINAIKQEVEFYIKKGDFLEEDIPVIVNLIKSFKYDPVMKGWTSDRLKNWLSAKAYQSFNNEVSKSVSEGRTDNIHKAYRSLQARVSRSDDKKDLLDETVWNDLIKYQSEVDYRRISTGLPAIDVMLGGGLYKNEFGLVFGVESLGKSFLGIQFGFGCWAEHRRVLHITNEMPVPDVMLRYMTKLTSTPKDQLPTNKKTLEAIRLSSQGMAGLLDVRYIAPGETSASVSALLEEGLSDNKPYELVVIDYLDQFTVAGAKDKPIWDQLSSLCSEFSSMAKPVDSGGYGVCIVAITHADSKAYDKQFISAKNMGLSKIGKNKVVDFALAIGQDEKGRKAGCIFLQVTKLRNRSTEHPRLICRTAYETASFIPTGFGEIDI